MSAKARTAWQKNRGPALAVSAAAFVLAATSAASAQSPAVRFAGVRACAVCHGGSTSGGPYGWWQLSRHARAYSSLAGPEAKRIAELSGVVQDPHQSPICLACHATASDTDAAERNADFRVSDGVQCETCHGAGAEHAQAATTAAAGTKASAPLRKPIRDDCRRCHYVKGSHAAVCQRPAWDIEKAWKAIAHGMGRESSVDVTVAGGPEPPAAPPLETAPRPRYKTPRNLAQRPRSTELWVVCESSDSVVIVDAKRRVTLAEVAVGRQPNDVGFSPDGSHAYVSNRLDDSVSIVDGESRQVVATVAVGDEPHGLATDGSGNWLFVANAAEDSVSVIDSSTLREVKRLAASRSPWSVAPSPDGQRLLVSNALSRLVPFREPPVSEITVIAADRGQVETRLALPEANLLLGAAWHPTGRFALVTLNRTKNLVPMTRILQGWTISNGLGIIWADGRVDQVLLDEPNVYFADAVDVAMTPEGRYALVTSRGTDRVAIIDVEKLLAAVERRPSRERAEVLPNHLGVSSEFVIASVATRNAPSGIAVSHDATTAFVANSLDDSLTVVDLVRMTGSARIDLGGPKEITKARWGARLFHSANVTFQRQFSCATCHPDGHVDGLTYDIEADGIGQSPVDNRTLRGILDTDPFKWEGTNPSLARQCGARLAVFFTRIQPFTPEELAAVNEYTATIPRPPNRYRPLGAPLNPAQARGKATFERSRTNDGRLIPEEVRCVTCHPLPYYTDRRRHDVGTKMWLDRQGQFDTPHLNNIYDSAPYLHNGIAQTLEEIWTRHNFYETHGVTSDLTRGQLNDLVEYLKTL